MEGQLMQIDGKTPEGLGKERHNLGGFFEALGLFYKRREPRRKRRQNLEENIRAWRTMMEFTTNFQNYSSSSMSSLYFCFVLSLIMF